MSLIFIYAKFLSVDLHYVIVKKATAQFLKTELQIFNVFLDAWGVTNIKSIYCTLVHAFPTLLSSSQI